MPVYDFFKYIRMFTFILYCINCLENVFFGDDYTMDDVEKIFDDNGVGSNKAERRAALIRYSSVHIDAQLWMEQHFGYSVLQF